MGDFTGFTFNNYHSWDDLGIVRVSDGDRYKDDLLPDFDDATINIPGGDGTYYFGSYYKSKKFTINFAFDTLTEQQYRNLRRVFSTRKPSTLIFDECPYKAYKVKVEGPPTIDAVCFDEGNLVWTSHDSSEGWIPGSVNHPTNQTENVRRIYKGEGEISLVAYEPFAHAPYKCLQDYMNFVEYTSFKEGDKPVELGLYEKNGSVYELTTDTTVSSQKTYYKREDTVNEWAAASGMLETLGNYDIFENNKINVYNPGDLSAPFQLYIPFSSGEISAFEIVLEDGTESDTPVPVDGARLKVGAITRIDDLDSGVIINTKNHLIEGVKDNGDGSYTTTGTVYNNYIIEGDFFNINCDGALGAFDGLIVFEGNIGNQNETPVIIYDYIYF